MMVLWRGIFTRRRLIPGLLVVALVVTSLFAVPLSGGAAGSGSGSMIYAASSAAAGDKISFGVKRVETGSGSSASAYFMLTNVNVNVATNTAKADEIRSMIISYPSTLSIDTTSASAIPAAGFSSWKPQKTVTDSKAGNKISGYNMSAPISSAQAALALSNLRFVSGVKGKDKGSIEVTYFTDAISWVEARPNGSIFRHLYQRADANNVILWQDAYNAALTKTFCGLNGYLCTMMYEEEGNAIASFTSTSGWLAATRYRHVDINRTKIGKDPATGNSRAPAPSRSREYYIDGAPIYDGGRTASVEDGAPGNNWYWCAGPSWENGRQFYAVGRFDGKNGAEDPARYHDENGNPMWNNWQRGVEPSNSFEGVMQTFLFNGKTQWNDLRGISTSTIKSYYIEYSEGWASEGGGTYIPPSSTSKAALPISKVTLPASKPDKDKETSAKAKKKYNISFSPNWGKLKIKKSYKSAWKSKFKPRPGTKKVTSGKTYGALPGIKKNPKGYKFAGWYTAKSGGKRITAKIKVTIKKSATLYAHWKKLQKYGKVVNTGAVYVRGKPSLHVNLNPVIGQLKKGKTFKIRAVIDKGKSNRWYKMTYKGKTAYVFAKYVKVIYK